MGGSGSKAKTAESIHAFAPTPPDIPRYWRVTIEGPRGRGGSGERRWLGLSLTGPALYPGGGPGGPPCVYVVPENDTPEEAEGEGEMPRVKLMSADRAVLTGPQRGAEAGSDAPEYLGGAAAVTRDSEDARDYLQAFPAPVAGRYSADRLSCYLWSPSREAALVVGPGGRLVWSVSVSRRAVKNFGIASGLTVWTVARDWGGE